MPDFYWLADQSGKHGMDHYVPLPEWATRPHDYTHLPDLPEDQQRKGKTLAPKRYREKVRGWAGNVWVFLDGSVLPSIVVLNLYWERQA